MRLRGYVLTKTIRMGFRFHIIVITLTAQSMRRLDFQSGASRIK